MSNRPVNNNLAQVTLYHLGEKRMGEDFANMSRDDEVRRQGIRNLVGKAVGAVAIGALGTGIAALGAWSFDRSPTVVYQEQLRQDATAAANQNVLHPDPSQAVMRINPGNPR